MFPLYDHNPIKRVPFLTIALIVANVAVQWWMSQLPEQRAIHVICEHGFVANRLTRMDNPQPIVLEFRFADPNGRPANRPPLQITLSTDTGSVMLTLITMMFLHGGWLHMLSNMWMLWVFGNNIEDRLGHFAFIAFYLVGGIVATLAQWVTDPASQTPMVGASGAVAATLGAYALTYPWAKVRTLVFIGLPLLLDLPALLVLGTWLVLETVMGAVAMQMQLEVAVAHWAHIGGFIAGAFIMPLLTLGISPPGEDWQREADSQFDFQQGSPSEKPRSRKADVRDPFDDPRFR